MLKKQEEYDPEDKSRVICTLSAQAIFKGRTRAPTVTKTLENPKIEEV